MSKPLHFTRTAQGILIDLRQFTGMKPTKEMYCRRCQKEVKAFGPAACRPSNRPDREWRIAPTWLTLRCFCCECGWLFRQLAVPGPVKSKVLTLDHNECVYCGRRATPGEPLSFDHLIPQLFGGRESVENIVLACSTCNSSKGAKRQWYKPQHGRFKVVEVRTP